MPVVAKKTSRQKSSREHCGNSTGELGDRKSHCWSLIQPRQRTECVQFVVYLLNSIEIGSQFPAMCSSSTAFMFVDPE